MRTLDCKGAIPRPIELRRRRLWRVAEIERWLQAGAPAREQWEALQDLPAPLDHARAEALAFLLAEHPSGVRLYADLLIVSGYEAPLLRGWERGDIERAIEVLHAAGRVDVIAKKSDVLIRLRAAAPGCAAHTQALPAGTVLRARAEARGQACTTYSAAAQEVQRAS